MKTRTHAKSILNIPVQTWTADQINLKTLYHLLFSEDVVIDGFSALDVQLLACLPAQCQRLDLALCQVYIFFPLKRKKTKTETFLALIT